MLDKSRTICEQTGREERVYAQYTYFKIGESESGECFIAMNIYQVNMFGETFCKMSDGERSCIAEKICSKYGSNGQADDFLAILYIKNKSSARKAEHEGYIVLQINEQKYFQLTQIPKHEEYTMQIERDVENMEISTNRPIQRSIESSIENDDQSQMKEKILTLVETMESDFKKQELHQVEDNPKYLHNAHIGTDQQNVDIISHNIEDIIRMLAQVKT